MSSCFVVAKINQKNGKEPHCHTPQCAPRKKWTYQFY
jgi:hypothetical protein